MFKQKFKSVSATFGAIIFSLAPIAIPISVSAATSNGCGSSIAGAVSQGAGQAAGQPGSIGCSSADVSTSNIGNLAHNVVNIFSIIVGAVAILMLIYGGFRYITSGGESGRVGNAKNTLIYAIIGLIIVALAQLIVHFVLFQSNNIQQGSTSPT